MGKSSKFNIMKSDKKRVEKEREMCTLAPVCRTIKYQQQSKHHNLGGSCMLMRFYFPLYGAVNVKLLIFSFIISPRNDEYDMGMNGMLFISFFSSLVVYFQRRYFKVQSKTRPHN